MKTKLITAPLISLSLLIEAKNFYRFIGDEADADISRSLSASMEKAEQITNRQLGIATYAAYLDTFQSKVTLPKPPFIAVTKVEYIDIGGATKPFTDFYLDDIIEPAVLYFNSFPSDVKTDGVNNVIITYECGYETMPDAIKSWILIYGLTMFENRENIVIGAPVDVKIGAYYNRLLDSYRIIPV